MGPTRRSSKVCQNPFVGVRSARLEVTKDKEKLATFRMIDVAQLVVFGRVQVSTQALHECFARNIPFLWMSTGGWLVGFATGQAPRYVELRRRQTAVHAQGGNGLAQSMIAGKIANCRTLLRRNARGDLGDTLAALDRLAHSARSCDNFASLLGFEGTAARLYFEALPAMLKDTAKEFADEFAAGGRNRRPPRDPVNALLSFCYAMLVKDLVAVTIGVGLDPLLGVYHRPRHGRPSLALDLAEEFRPLVADSTVIGLLNNGEIGAADFIRRGGAVALTSAGRRTVLRAYERRLDTEIRHPHFGYRISYRRILDLQARILGAVLVGELPEYLPMTTR